MWGLLTNVEEIEAALDRHIEEERRRLREPEREAETLAGRLVDLDRQRLRLQDAYMQGAFELDELKARLADLEEGREATEEALAAARNRSGRIAELRLFKAHLGEYAWYTMAELNGFTPERKHREYRRLRLRVEVRPDGELVATWGFGGEMAVPKTDAVEIVHPDGRVEVRERCSFVCSRNSPTDVAETDEEDANHDGRL